MSTLEEIKALTVYELAGMAECGKPDSSDSAGALFLSSVRDGFVQSVVDNGGVWDEDRAHEIADAAPDVYDHTRWLEFVDLAAYQEENDSGGGWPSDLTEAAGVALYQIASRLLGALGFDLDEDEDGDDV